MKKTILVSFFGSLVLSSCNSKQPATSPQADSIKPAKIQIDSAENISKQASAEAGGNMIKAESPDAAVHFEQGYALPSMTDGTAQSPVNILSSNVQNEAGHHIDVKFNGAITSVENLGHTIQVDFANGSTTTVNGKSYELKQLHFHTPSEHLIDGMTFPMEMHIVSKLNDSIRQEGSTYTVVGILFKIGHVNKFLDEFLNAIPKEEGNTNLDQQKVNLKDFFENVPQGTPFAYYQYQGSLTTPPYTESVNWLVRKRIFEASEAQFKAIVQLEGDNARHIHSLNKRKITSE